MPYPERAGSRRSTAAGLPRATVGGKAAGGRKRAAMRSGGFPCRYGGCDVRFAVQEQGSLPALLAASAARSEHEQAVHAYQHVRLEDVVRKPSWALRKAADAPKR